MISIFLFSAIDVQAFIIIHPHNANHHRNSRTVLYDTAVESPAIKEDVDVVGEGRRGDAKGAALRLVDVAVSRGGTTLLSNIDWRVEPKSKWGLVVSTTLAPALRASHSFAKEKVEMGRLCTTALKILTCCY